MQSFFDLVEEDFFNFVYNPESLDIKKRQFIEKNLDIFYEQIELLKSTKANEADELSEEEKEEITAAIKKAQTQFELFPHKMPKIEPQIVLAAASDSAALTHKITSTTLSDVDSKYMIRILNFKGFSEIFVIPADLKPMPKFKIKLHPTELEFFGDETTQMFKTEKLSEIERIQLEILD